MTLPFERTAAVLNTREFLLSLLDPKQTPRVPKKVRHQARQLLKHYPYRYNFDEMFEDKWQKVFGPVS